MSRQTIEQAPGIPVPCALLSRKSRSHAYGIPASQLATPEGESETSYSVYDSCTCSPSPVLYCVPLPSLWFRTDMPAIGMQNSSITRPKRPHAFPLMKHL